MPCVEPDEAMSRARDDLRRSAKPLAVENNCHWIDDVVFAEDDRHWVDAPQGMVVIQLLRRIACNLLALFREFTLRSGAGRRPSWPQLLRAFMRTLARFAAANGAAPRDGPSQA